MALKLYVRDMSDAEQEGAYGEKIWKTFRLDSPCVREILQTLIGSCGGRIRQREKKGDDEDVIKKLNSTLAIYGILVWMTKTIMKVSGQTDWFWCDIYCWIPFANT